MLNYNFLTSSLLNVVLLFEILKLSFGGSGIWTRATLVTGSDADH